MFNIVPTAPLLHLTTTEQNKTPFFCYCRSCGSPFSFFSFSGMLIFQTTFHLPVPVTFLLYLLPTHSSNNVVARPLSPCQYKYPKPTTISFYFSFPFLETFVLHSHHTHWYLLAHPHSTRRRLSHSLTTPQSLYTLYLFHFSVIFFRVVLLLNLRSCRSKFIPSLSSSLWMAPDVHTTSNLSTRRPHKIVYQLENCALVLLFSSCQPE